MNAAIIGCGAISIVHADALIKQNIKISALCDIRQHTAENLKAKFSLECNIYSDYKQMLSTEDIDVVHICTPHYLHADMAVFALSKDINVLLEKPACINENEIQMLIKAQKNSKAQLGICFQNRYLEGIIAAKQFLANKKILGISSTVCWSRDKEYYTDSDWKGRKNTEGGGVLINQAIHVLDLMLWIGQYPKYVVGNVFNGHLQDIIDVEDTADIYYETESGNALLYATTAASKNYPINIKIDAGEHLVEIIGESCEIDGVKFLSKHESTLAKDYWGLGHYKLIQDYYACLKDNRKFPIDIEEGSKALKVLFAVYKSNGKSVKIDSCLNNNNIQTIKKEN